MLRFWNGGMASHGVILGALAGILFFCLVYKRNVFVIADELVIPAALFLALGQIGNHINGEVYGYSTSVWWAIKFPYAEGFRHPVALYDGIKNLLLIPILFSVRRRVVAGTGYALGPFYFLVWFSEVVRGLFPRSRHRIIRHRYRTILQSAYGGSGAFAHKPFFKEAL